MRCSVLLLFFVACVAPQQRHELRDGAPVRAAPVEPVTTYTPAGAGLPEYWGAPATAVEQSPHKRVLPQTPSTRREDGLWAVKEPEEDGPAIILDTVLPFPDESPAVTDECAKGISAAVARGDPMKRREGFSRSLRECIAARLYLVCVTTMEADATRDGVVDIKTARVIKKTKDVAEKFEQSVCDGVEWPHIAEAYVIGMHGIWKDYIRK